MKTLRVLSAFSVLLAVTLSLANVPQAAADPVKGVVSLECSVPTTTGSVITGASSSDSTTTVLATGNSCVEAIKELINIDHRSEEHTSELQSRGHLVCRLLL